MNKQQRKCSSCRKVGHNKRTCPGNEVKNTKKSVFIRVSQEAPPSVHVVDLKDNSQVDVWKEVTAYTEKKVEPKKRATINFAALVRSEKKETKKQPVRMTIAPVLPPKKIEHVQSARKKRSFSWPQLSMPSFRAPRFAFAAVALIALLVLPFPAASYYQKVQLDSRRVVEQSTNAFLSLQSSTVAALHADIAQAQYDLNEALSSFHQARSIVDQEHKALVYVASVLPVIGTQVTSRQHVLQAGHHLALGNSYLVKGFDEAQNTDQPVTDRLRLLRTHLRGALPQYEAALTDLGGVDIKTIPSEYQQSFEDFKLLYATFVDDMNDMVGLIDTLTGLLGDDDIKTYLVVGQNNHELRATGGFMGSFGVVTVQKGKVTRIDVPGGGTYDLQGQLDVYVEPPLPLQAVNPRWEFQDANWFPDFPESANKIEWFYEHAWNESVDGVIAINASVLERILGVLGPIENENFDITLDQETGLETLQTAVELDYDKEENKPKAVIGDSLQLIMNRLAESETVDLVRLLSELMAAMEEKEIQISVNEPSLEETIRTFGWNGQVAETKEQQDYLMVVASSIFGGKSDAKISQEIEHQAVIQDDGTVLNTVVIRREHNGTPDELFYGAANLSYMRIYVPEGATLIDAQGFDFPPEEAFTVPESWYEEDQDLLRVEKDEEYHSDSGTRITNEFGKTVFGNWMAVAPTGISEAYIAYLLPFNVMPEEKEQTRQERWKEYVLPKQQEASRYSLYVQKQSGTKSSFNTSIIYPSHWHPAWTSRDDISMASNGVSFEGTLDTDEIIGVVMKEETNK